MPERGAGLRAGKLCLHLGPHGGGWREKFERSPKGFGEQALTEEDLRNRERAEYARALLVGAVDAFRAKVRGVNAEAISRAVYFCLKTLGAENSRPLR